MSLIGYNSRNMWIGITNMWLETWFPVRAGTPVFNQNVCDADCSLARDLNYFRGSTSALPPPQDDWHLQATLWVNFCIIIHEFASCGHQRGWLPYNYCIIIHYNLNLAATWEWFLLNKEFDSRLRAGFGRDEIDPGTDVISGALPPSPSLWKTNCPVFDGMIKSVLSKQFWNSDFGWVKMGFQPIIWEY